MNKTGWFRVFLFVALLLSLLGSWMPALAQSGESDRPIDMLIVVDNSCSMFPKEMLVAGCTSFGSDVNFLRISGADMFLARLGFDQPGEENYQVGIISLGDKPKLISPLRPLAARRDDMAALIANPSPETATRLVPALELAFEELTTSPNRIEENLPAVVLITDGVPYPSEGQSNADIENLIQQYPDIPLFLMILKGAEANLDTFDQYVAFWQSMQQKQDNVFVYLIEKPEQIQDTYNTIVSLLQDTIPVKGSLVTPGTQLPFYVSKYIDKVVITTSYPPDSQKGDIRIIDPRGQIVLDGEPGVARFSGKQNPVEVISISAPRLAQEYKDQFWNLEADWVTNVFIDRLGAYRIQIDSPEVNPLTLKNVYLAGEGQSPRQPFVIQFHLVDNENQAVLEPQPVWAEVMLPDGTLAQVPFASEVRPDADGVYELRFDLPAIYPYVSDRFARFVFVIHAGSAGESVRDGIPIASARLLVDVGPTPFIQFLNPARIDCAPGAAQKIQVSIGDYQSVISGTLQATVVSSLGTVILTGDNDELDGDLSGLCQALLSQFACGEQGEETFTLKIGARLVDDRPFELMERLIPVQLIAPECTPLPTQTESAFVLPTPRPTPVPDVDSDGFDDLSDGCPSLPGSGLFNGCPIPTWFWLAGAALLVGIVVILAGIVWPRISLRYISPPPDVFVAVISRDSPAPVIYSVRDAGIQRRTKRVRIGGDKKKADIYVAGLKAVEFSVEWRGDKIVLLDAFKGETKATFRQLSAEKVATSNPGVLIWVATKRSSLERMT